MIVVVDDDVGVVGVGVDFRRMRWTGTRAENKEGYGVSKTMGESGCNQTLTWTQNRRVRGYTGEGGRQT